MKHQDTDNKPPKKFAQGMTRRSFLRGVTAGAAATVLPGCSEEPPSPPPMFIIQTFKKSVSPDGTGALEINLRDESVKDIKTIEINRHGIRFRHVDGRIYDDPEMMFDNDLKNLKIHVRNNAFEKNTYHVQVINPEDSTTQIDVELSSNSLDKAANRERELTTYTVDLSQAKHDVHIKDGYNLLKLKFQGLTPEQTNRAFSPECNTYRVTEKENGKDVTEFTDLGNGVVVSSCYPQDRLFFLNKFNDWKPPASTYKYQGLEIRVIRHEDEMDWQPPFEQSPRGR